MSTSLYVHFFEGHILSILASLGGHTYSSLLMFPPCKNVVLMSIELSFHFFCTIITLNTIRKFSFEQVRESFNISSFVGSSKALATSHAFGICWSLFYFKYIPILHVLLSGISS